MASLQSVDHSKLSQLRTVRPYAGRRREDNPLGTSWSLPEGTACQFVMCIEASESGRGHAADITYKEADAKRTCVVVFGLNLSLNQYPTITSKPLNRVVWRAADIANKEADAKDVEAVLCDCLVTQRMLKLSFVVVLI